MEREMEVAAEKESILSIVSNKIDEAYDWLKAKLKSLFNLFSESIPEALQRLSSFVASCCEKLREVLSGINTQMDNLSEKKLAVVQRFPEKGSLQDEMKMQVQKMGKALAYQWCRKMQEVLSGANTQMDTLSEKKLVVVQRFPGKGSLQDEMKMQVQKMRKLVYQWLEVGCISHLMKVAGLKLNKFLDLAEGFIELLGYDHKQPFCLIRVLLDGYMIYCMTKKAGGVQGVSKHKGQAAMAIITLITLIC